MKIKNQLSLAFLLCLFAGEALAQVGVTREWVSADGRNLTAELVDFSDGGVEVSVNGKVMTIKDDQLSEADQQFLAELRKSRIAQGNRLAALKEGPFAESVTGLWTSHEGTGEDLPYHLFIGPGAVKEGGEAEIPLFIHLHDLGSDVKLREDKPEIMAQKVASKPFYELAKNESILVAPKLADGSESWLEKLPQVEALIDRFAAGLPVNRKRIYLSGNAEGAVAVGELLKKRPDFYAAAVVAEWVPGSELAAITKTPIWSSLSTEFDVSSLEEIEQKFEGRSVEFRHKVIPSTNSRNIDSRTARTNEIYQWFYEQTK